LVSAIAGTKLLCQSASMSSADRQASERRPPQPSLWSLLAAQLCDLLIAKSDADALEAALDATINRLRASIADLGDAEQEHGSSRVPI
jgi:hypothetical protein